MFDYLIESMDGREFDTYEQYENTIHAVISDAERELGRAERWACQRDKSVVEQLGATIKEEL